MGNPHQCLQFRKNCMGSVLCLTGCWSNNYGFTTHLLDSRCMGSWIHNGFFDSQKKLFGSGGFWDSRCFLGFTMRSGIHDWLVQLLGGVTKVFKCWYSEPYSNVGAQMSTLGTCFKCLLHVYREPCSCSSSMCSLICIDAWLQTFGIARDWISKTTCSNGAWWCMTHCRQYAPACETAEAS